MTGVFIVVQLPDGYPAAFPASAVADARAAAVTLGFAPPPAAAGASAPERWLTSKELAAHTGVPDTWWEAAAKDGRIPAIRCGKYVRFRLSEVLAARGRLETGDTRIRQPRMTCKSAKPNGQKRRATGDLPISEGVP
jgi:excisionase family DNA binding protein